MAQKPSIPKGTRDFSPMEMMRRNYIFDTIRSVFKLYGYQPIETPAMENLSTLLGKYGEEGDKLLFRVLNSGDFLQNLPLNDNQLPTANKLAPLISEKGLRYDLTVPFARYVVQYRNDITFPFKRYQIQPVWRADRPQKGRYREFYQCDVDVIGSDSLLNEVELIQIIDAIFSALRINVKILINNRKILAGISEVIGEAAKITDITVAIDKLDKIGAENVNTELAEKGIPAEAIEKLQPILNLQGNTAEKLEKLQKLLENSATGLKGIEEMKTVFGYFNQLNLTAEAELNLTLARGLNYYTGAIIEVKAMDVPMGSICGGGRYDDLTGIFGLPGVSGVGVSFGADRIYDVMNELNLFPENKEVSSQVLLVNFGAKEEKYCLNVATQLRQKGINTDIYPESTKIKKQMAYADAKNIPYVIIIGSEEMKSGILTLKNMITGKQENLSEQEIIQKLIC
ncbi:MAG: histidine--tRNA ligase [Lentimicrobiaceae bacterium]|nr:histidine--tRNA ligase [Lentimicrobiaceae bacterium]